MIVSQKHNILYKDRMSHKSKSIVTTAQLSDNKNFNKTPLKRDANDISFKGAFSFYNIKKYNLEKNMAFLKKYIGHVPESLERNFNKPGWVDIRDHIKKLNGNQVEVATKNWPRLLLEGIVYPVAELPLHIANGAKKFITKKSFATSGEKTLEQMGKRNILQKKLDILNNSDIVNSFSGYMETAEKYQYDTEKVASSSLFTKAMKMFDPKSGNYNGVHERALTRIVTGFIPAFFLANDAYNLSRLCDDDAKEAKAEHKTRFNQETKRVLSNAYLQLITLGALSKYINAKKWVFMLVTALTVVATESYSRLSNGKKLHFINKEEAIELNKKQAQKEDKTISETKVQKAKNNTTENQHKTQTPSFKGSKVFQNFGFAAYLPITTAVPSDSEDPAKKLAALKPEKPLLTLSTITKWFVGVVAAGFALKYAKKNIKINGATLGKYFDVISNKYDKIYNKITRKNYTISQEKFNKIVEKLREYDEVIGQKFNAVTREYQKTVKLGKEAKNIANALEKAGLKEEAQMFRHLANKGLKSEFSHIKIQAAAEEFFRTRDSKIIEENVTNFLELLKTHNFGEAAENIKNILYKNGKFSTKNYTKAKKFIERRKELKQFATTFENRFKVNVDEENLKMFESAMKKLTQIDSKVAEELTTTIENAQYAETLTLGNRNIKGIREIADFITQPFKFAWGTITLPFKHIANPLFKAIKQEYPLPKWDKEIDVVYNGINKLTYKPKLKANAIPKIELGKEEFHKYMDLQINKAFNNATMSSISNSDLSALAKNTSTAATAWFLMADNHNMVMLKSNGEDKDGALMKAKERAIQETSRTFYNVLFINLFNDTFRNTYNSSLLGAQSVNMASTLIGEYVNRKAIGMPVKQSSRNDILNKEYENLTSKGAKGKFFRFMSRLTGKKALSQRESTQKK